MQIFGNRLALTCSVFRLDSGEWHCVEEVEIDYEITDNEIDSLLHFCDEKEYQLEESAFSMSEGMI